MKIWDEFKAWVDQVKEYFQTELELIKLKSVKTVSAIVARAYALIFFLIFINITMILGGLWLGFFLSELLGSTVHGFGLAFFSFILLFALFVRFRKALLIGPFQNLMIRALRQSLDQKKDHESDGKA